MAACSCQNLDREAWLKTLGKAGAKTRRRVEVGWNGNLENLCALVDHLKSRIGMSFYDHGVAPMREEPLCGMSWLFNSRR